MLNWLGVKPSYSRPRVSDDNAYAESLFRTAKYRPEFPAKGFATLDEARIWAAEFVRWYNVDHRHSGIRYVSPSQRHAGHDRAILAARHALAGVHLGRTLAHLGQPDEGMAQAQQGLARCRAVGNPFDLVQNLYWTAECHLSAGDAAEALRLLDELPPLAHQHSAPVYSIVGQLLRLAALGPARADPTQVAGLLAQVQAAGEHWGDVSHLLLLARAQWAHGDAAAAQAGLHAAQRAESTGGLFTAQVRQIEADLQAARGDDRR